MSQEKRATHVDVRIEGDVSGQIAIGDNILQIGDVHGGIVNIIQPDRKPTFSPRQRPVMVRPRKFTGFLDHDSEMGGIVEALNEGEPVSLYAENGMGKTTLLRHLAYQAPGDNFPDGILYFPAHIKCVADMQQIIFDHFFTSDSLAKPTDAELSQFLQNVQALILLDDVQWNKDEINELLNAVPQSVFVLASPERCLWGEGRCIALQGLPLQDALTLIEHELQRTLTPVERASAEHLYQIATGQPLFLIQVAALVRDGKSFEEILNAVKGSKDGFGEIIAERLNETQRDILGLLSIFKEFTVPKKHLVALLGIRGLAPQLDRLKKLQLVREHGSVIGLAGSMAVPLGPLLEADWEARSLDYFVHWMRGAPSLPEVREALDLLLFLLEHAFNAGRWEAVISLGRGIESTLILSGLWGTWLQVLQWLLAAAGSLGEQSLRAWVLHQLGARSLCLGDLSAAQSFLAQALGIRETLADQAASALTRQALGVTTTLPAPAGVTLSHTAIAPWTAVSTVVKAILIVGGLVGVVGAVVRWNPASRLLPEPGTVVSPAPLDESPAEADMEASSIEPVSIPTEMTVSIETPFAAATSVPTATVVLINIPVPVECTFDVDFVVARQLKNEVVLSFDMPFDIPNENMDHNRNIDLGDKLTVQVNDGVATGYRTGLYDVSRPDRLFILLPEFHRNDTIQVQLWDDKALHCSPIVLVDWIDPYVEPPKAKSTKTAEPATSEEPAACVPQSCGDTSIWNPDLCCCEYSPGYCE